MIYEARLCCASLETKIGLLSMRINFGYIVYRQVRLSDVKKALTFAVEFDAPGWYNKITAGDLPAWLKPQ